MVDELRALAICEWSCDSLVMLVGCLKLDIEVTCQINWLRLWDFTWSFFNLLPERFSEFFKVET